MKCFKNKLMFSIFFYEQHDLASAQLTNPAHLLKVNEEVVRRSADVPMDPLSNTRRSKMLRQ